MAGLLHKLVLFAEQPGIQANLLQCSRLPRIHVYICIYICIYIFTYVCIHTYIYIIYMYINVYNFMYLYIDVYVHQYLCMFTYMYIYMHIYVCSRNPDQPLRVLPLPGNQICFDKLDQQTAFLSESNSCGAPITLCHTPAKIV